MQICKTQHHNTVVSGDIGYGMGLERNNFLVILLSPHNVIHETEEHVALTEASTSLHLDCVMLVILKEKLSIYHHHHHLSSLSGDKTLLIQIFV